MISLIKTIYTYFFNWFALLRIRKVGKKIFIKRHLKVSSPEYIEIGDGVRIGIYGRLECYRANGKTGSIILGNEVSIGDFCTILSGGDIYIGDKTWFASFITILGESHGLDPQKGIYCGQSLVGKDVKIGKCCWLGEKVIVMPGVTIGEWSVIGAGAVVTHDIPPYSIAVGSPAKVIKKYDIEKGIWVKV